MFETNRFRKFVSDLWIDRGLKPILGSGTTQNWRRTPRRLDLQIGIFGYLVICTTDGACKDIIRLEVTNSHVSSMPLPAAMWLPIPRRLLCLQSARPHSTLLRRQRQRGIHIRVLVPLQVWRVPAGYFGQPRVDRHPPRDAGRLLEVW